MWINTASFAAGIMLCQQLASLPAVFWAIAGIPISFFIGKKSRFSVIGYLLLGFCWAVLWGHWALQDRLSPDLIGKTLKVTGHVIDLPDKVNLGWRFNFVPELASAGNSKVRLPGKIRLSWYRSKAVIRSGQTWVLQVRLKPPVGSLNPGVFDYETWLFQQGIGGKGYVLDTPVNRLIAEGSWYTGFGYIREKLRSILDRHSAHPEAAAILRALTVGDKSAITPSMWEAFRLAGVNHLVAISGLHIGMIAMVAYWLAGLFWRCSARLCELLPAPYVQSISGIAAAVIYAGLAGFSIPTQRALIMLLVILLAKIQLINIPPARQLSIAVFVILLLDPVAITSPGFWLSFIAVIAIYLALRKSSVTSKARQLVSLQWSITLLLLPFSLLWFNQVSVISPLVNLLLVPLFSLFIVPLSLLSALLSLSLHPAVFFLTQEYLAVLQAGLNILQQVTQFSWVAYRSASLEHWHFLVLLFSAFVWHFPARKMFRLAALALILVILLNLKREVNGENFRMTLLDVGQGLSVFIEQGENKLLYDLGPRYGNSGSATQSIVVPFLKSRGVKQIDQLIISHSDSDHSGNLDALLGEIEVDEILTGETGGKLKNPNICQSGMSWQWATAFFQILSPDTLFKTGNNASCVIRITLPQASILLTGDIEEKVEMHLLASKPDLLAADIIVVAHHGSGTSSGQAFVDAVSPGIVLNSSGFLNRYHFPDARVKQRWLEKGRVFLDTAMQGAVEIELDKNGSLVSLSPYRRRHQKYWYWNR